MISISSAFPVLPAQDSLYYELLALTAICGEVPCACADRLTSSKSYRKKVVTSLTHDKLLRIFSKDHLRGYRLGIRGKRLLRERAPERFQFYLSGRTDTNSIKSSPARRLRLHRMGLGTAKAAASTATAKATPSNTFAGGLSGMVSRHVQQSTANSISGQSGGIGTSLGGAMYHNSLGKDGGFASKVIGSIATGQTGGCITGDSAVEALNGYFAGTSDMDAMQIPATGENIPTAMATAESDTVTDSPIPATPLALEGDSTVDVSPTRDSEITMHAGGSPAVTEQTTIPTSSSIQQAAMNRVLLGQMGNSVTDVEIGGGKIQGREIIPGRGQIQFAMYNARQYEKPEGHFTEQTSRDGEKWYKVYATTRVEKTPTVQDERGRMQYDERKVAAMPKAPARRH